MHSFSIKFYTCLIGALCAGLFSQDLHGVAYMAKCYFRDGSVRILIYDYHRDFEGGVTTRSEVGALEHFGKDCFFIVEDREGYRGRDADTTVPLTELRIEVARHYKADPPTEKPVKLTGIFGFMKRLDHNKMRGSNIEFRFGLHRLAFALFIDADYRTGALRTPLISVDKVLDLMDKIKADARAAYDKVKLFKETDAPALKAWYEQCIVKSELFFTEVERVKALVKKDGIGNGEMFREICKQNFDATTDLIDAFIVHAMQVNRFEPCIILYAGGKHCQAVEGHLVNAGYRLIHTEGRKIDYSRDTEVDIIKNAARLTTFFTRILANPNVKAVFEQAKDLVAPEPITKNLIDRLKELKKKLGELSVVLHNK